MRKFTILLLLMGLAWIGPPVAQADEIASFSSASGAFIEVFADCVIPGDLGYVTFAPGTAANPAGSGSVTADFTITMVNGQPSPADGDVGTITPPAAGWTIGAISTEATSLGTVEVASLTGTGTLTIEDHAGNLFTGTLQLVQIETNVAGSYASFDDGMLVNLTGVTYSGTDPVLTALALVQNDVFELSTATFGLNLYDLTFTDPSGLPIGIDALTLGDSYSGTIAPIPGTALLLGFGLLGLALIGFLRKRMT